MCRIIRIINCFTLIARIVIVRTASAGDTPPVWSPDRCQSYIYSYADVRRSIVNAVSFKTIITGVVRVAKITAIATFIYTLYSIIPMKSMVQPQRMTYFMGKNVVIIGLIA